MKEITKQSFIQILMTMSIAVVIQWLSSAYLVYFIAKPLISHDNGRSLVFDPIALIDATSVIVVIAIISWVPIYLFAQQKPFIWRLSLTSISTWALLSLCFHVIENASTEMYEWLTVHRAILVLGNCNDLLFMPLVIPFISALSGVAYSTAVACMNSIWVQKLKPNR
jgi:hypothetical protein